MVEKSPNYLITIMTNGERVTIEFIYSGSIPKFKDGDIFNVVVPLFSDTQSGAQSVKTINDDKSNLIMQYCYEPKSLNDISSLLNISSKRYIRERIIRPLINQGKLEFTNKNSVNARNQRYVTVKNKD